MDRLACVDVASLPLQVLLREHPDWHGLPVAVVAQDRPQAPVLLVNEEALARGVRPGQRLGAALAFASGLWAGVVPKTTLDGWVERLAARLGRFSPGVEPCEEEPGVFWLDVRGLGRLYGTTGAWGRAVREDLASLGFRARVAVGFTRFGTYAAARCGREFRAFRTPEDEAAATRLAPLASLGLSPEGLLGLARLGIRTVGDLLRLPAEAVRERFGEEVYRLHRRASGLEHEPLRPRAIEEPLCKEEDLDPPDHDRERLAFCIKRLLDPLLWMLAARRQAMAWVEVRFRLEGGEEVAWTLRPAEPTLEAGQVMGLVWLRLQAVDLPALVCGLSVRVEGAPATREQLRLFRQTRRDLAGAARTFARLRARFGDDAVVRAALREAHLPEARFVWEPMEDLAPPAPQAGLALLMVRRIEEGPKEVRVWSQDGLGPLGVRGHGRVAPRGGPFEVCGGWWGREVRRQYWFVETERGEVLWLFRDGVKGRWFLQGRVE